MFSLIVRKKFLQIFLAIIYLFELIINQIDIVMVYLESLLRNNNLPIFIKLLPKMETFRFGRTRLVCHLFCNIYKLKQSNRLWNQNVIAFFQSLGFITLNADPNILIYQKSGGNITIISVYIDDFLLILKNSKSVDWINERLNSKYNIKHLSKLKTIIKWQVTRNLKAKIFKIN